MNCSDCNGCGCCDQYKDYYGDNEDKDPDYEIDRLEAKETREDGREDDY